MLLNFLSFGVSTSKVKVLETALYPNMSLAYTVNVYDLSTVVVSPSSEVNVLEPTAGGSS